MCTLILAWQVFDDAPIVAAANRDERLDRESEPPARRPWNPPVLAPRDAMAGGTWIGYNATGVFTAITNRWTATDLDGDRSRGLLVRDALAEETAEEAVRSIERAVEDDEYQGFNLVVADTNAAVYLEWDGNLHVRNFHPGVHVVVNVGADGDYTIPNTNADRGEAQANDATAVLNALQPNPDDNSRSWLDRAAKVIADHKFGVCVHANGFGTRSSSLIRLGPDEWYYEFADGPPCETSFELVEVGLSPEGQL